VRYVALLRGINVGGRSKVPMAELREACARLGWENVATYIQSGNIVFESEQKANALESALEAVLASQFTVETAVLVRSARRWQAYVADNPFPKEAQAEPSRLMLCLAKDRPRPGCDEALEGRAKDGERVRRVGDALWVHYPEGAGRSKLSPSLFDRLAGSPATARNWRTVLKLQEMLQS